MHINERVLGIGLDNGCYSNNVNLTSVDVENSIRLFGKCRACVEGLMKAPAKKKSKSEPAREIGYRIAMDLIPLSETSLGGNNWGMIGTDEKCGYIFMCGMKKKNIVYVEDGIWNIVIEVWSYVHEVKEILFDNEQVFNAAAKFVRSKGIVPLYTPSGLHNNLSERYTQTVKTKKRILLAALPYVLPKILHLEALLSAARSCNISPNHKSGDTKTPYFLMKKRRPDIDEYSFGTVGLAYVIRADNRDVRGEMSLSLIHI